MDSGDGDVFGGRVTIVSPDGDSLDAIRRAAHPGDRSSLGITFARFD